MFYFNNALLLYMQFSVNFSHLFFLKLRERNPVFWTIAQEIRLKYFFCLSCQDIWGSTLRPIIEYWMFHCFRFGFLYFFLKPGFYRKPKTLAKDGIPDGQNSSLHILGAIIAINSLFSLLLFFDLPHNSFLFGNNFRWKASNEGVIGHSGRCLWEYVPAIVAVCRRGGGHGMCAAALLEIDSWWWAELVWVVNFLF